MVNPINNGQSLLKEGMKASMPIRWMEYDTTSCVTEKECAEAEGFEMDGTMS